MNFYYYLHSNILFKIINYYKNSGFIVILLFLLSVFLFSLLLHKYLYIKKISSDLFFNALDKEINDTVIVKYLPEINKYFKLISALIYISPLLGLLGTINGMIKIFETISYAGIKNINYFSYGISEALLTTKIGLIIAIIGYVFFGIIKKKSNEIKHRLYSSYFFFKSFK